MLQHEKPKQSHLKKNRTFCSKQHSTIQYRMSYVDRNKLTSLKQSIDYNHHITNIKHSSVSTDPKFILHKNRIENH